MSFHEHAVGGGTFSSQPLWACRCGIEVKVRAPLLPRKPIASGRTERVPVKTASLRELRETLALIRVQARVQRERAISLRERARAAIGDALQTGAISAVALDDSARHLAANQAASMLTGYSEAELIRMQVWDLAAVPRNGRGEQAWLELIDRGSRSGICVLRRKTGDAVTVRYAAVANILPGVHVAAISPREPVA